MKRPWLVWLLVIAHALFAAACVAGLWLILRETREPKVVAEGHDALRGLYLGAAGAAVCALLYARVAVGLWFRRRWTWWLGVTVNGLFGGAILLDQLTESNFDWEDIWFGLCLAVVTALLLLPPVRKFIFKRESATPKADVAQAQA